MKCNDWPRQGVQISQYQQTVDNIQRDKRHLSIVFTKNGNNVYINYGWVWQERRRLHQPQMFTWSWLNTHCWEPVVFNILMYWNTCVMISSTCSAKTRKQMVLLWKKCYCVIHVFRFILHRVTLRKLVLNDNFKKRHYTTCIVDK